MKARIHATRHYAEPAPSVMDGRCSWPGCDANIYRYAPYCMSHSRYITNAIKVFPITTADYIRKLIRRLPLGPILAINMIRVIERCRGLDYLSKKIGGLGV